MTAASNNPTRETRSPPAGDGDPKDKTSRHLEHDAGSAREHGRVEQQRPIHRHRSKAQGRQGVTNPPVAAPRSQWAHAMTCRRRPHRSHRDPDTRAWKITAVSVEPVTARRRHGSRAREGTRVRYAVAGDEALRLRPALGEASATRLAEFERAARHHLGEDVDTIGREDLLEDGCAEASARVAVASRAPTRG